MLRGFLTFLPGKFLGIVGHIVKGGKGRGK